MTEQELRKEGNEIVKKFEIDKNERYVYYGIWNDNSYSNPLKVKIDDTCFFI